MVSSLKCNTQETVADPGSSDCLGLLEGPQGQAATLRLTPALTPLQMDQVIVRIQETERYQVLHFNSEPAKMPNV